MSKVFLKIAGIISIVFASFYLFIFIIAHLAIPYNYLADNIDDYMILLMVAVVSLILAFGGIMFLHYKDLDEEELKTKRGFILAWSIFFLIPSTISSLFGLAAYYCLSSNIEHVSKIDYIEEIKELEKLKNKGLITEEEFAQKKRKILNI